MNRHLLNISANVHQVPPLVLLNISYDNSTQNEKYINPDEPALNVYDEFGAKLQNIGPTIKRPPLKLSDYIKLDPGKSYMRSIRLNDEYELLSGVKYLIEVPGGYFDPITEQDDKRPLIKLIFVKARG